MNIKFLLLILIIGVIVVGGIWFLLGSSSNNNSSQFIVGSAGNSISYSDKVILIVESGTFEDETKITINESHNSAQDSEVVMLSEYEFGPTGLVFDPPAELSIYYDPHDLPAASSESDIGLYVLESGKWKLINGSHVKIDENKVSASISHFSKMGAAVPSSGSGPSPEPTSEEDENDEDGIALAWFKADITFKSASTRDANPNHASQYDSTTYGYAAHVSWEPATYVMYYQVKFEFHGNPPEDYPWSYDYSERNDWDPKPYSYKEGLVYSLGYDYEKPNYIGQYNMAEVFGGRHGFPLGSFTEKIYDSEVNNGLSTELLLSELQEFSYAYFDGWEIWVRPIVETHS
jgi:hypothetical protein